MSKPDTLLMSYIVCDLLSKSDQTVAQEAWIKIIENMQEDFKKAGALRQTVSQILISSTFLDLHRLRLGQLSVIQKLHYWRAFLQFLNAINLSWKTMLAFLNRFYNQYLGQSGLGWYENFCHLH